MQTRVFGAIFNRFVWTMAWREMRGSLRHFIFFLFCIVLGVGGLVGVGSFASSLDHAIQKQARSLMAGDLEIRSNRSLSPDGEEVIQTLEERGIKATTIHELISMAANLESSSTQLVELKAVGAGYPFYGRLATEPEGALGALFNSRSALVEEALLIHLGLQTGDSIQLGGNRFTIAGIIRKEPDRVAGAFSLGPRVMISREALEGTGLVQLGSRVRYRILFMLPAAFELEQIKQELEKSLARENVRITSYREAQPRLRRFLENLTTYLGMLGLTALLVGGIGVANSVQVFLRGKLDTLAILKCLGAGSGTVLGIYLIQTLLMGLLGCLGGVALGLGVQRLLPVFFTGFLPADLNWTVTAGPIVRGVAMGLLTTLLFSLWPLLRFRGVPPSHIYRQDYASLEDGIVRVRGRSWLMIALILAGLAVLALWQAGSFNLGGLFIGVLAGSFIVLRLGAALAIRAVRTARQPRSLTWRHGLANLYRPGSQAILAILSIGVGVTVIAAVYLIEGNLLRHVGENIPKQAPSFFFIDIQADQKEIFERVLADQGKSANLTPIVRARIHAVENENVADIDLEGRRDGWYFQREYVVTSLEALPRDNKIKRGHWWDREADFNQPLISVEEDAAHHLGVDLGSTMTFDVQGLLVTATVSSIREVNWGNMSTNFFIIFSPGLLQNMPLTYIGTVQSNADEDAMLQRSIVSALPNVTAINIRHILDTVREVLEQIGSVVRFMGLFTIAAGLVVLSGAIAATRHWRIRESVILKTLGATRKVVAKTFAVEYAVLGAIAGLIGSVMASILAFILLRFVMDVPWQFEPLSLITGVVITLALTVVSGFLATFRILAQKPLAILRHE